jgi:DNA-binding CsgD family transcriptional regulator
MKLFGGLGKKRIIQYDCEIPAEVNNGGNGAGTAEQKQRSAGDERAERKTLLTPREYDVFLLLLEGYTLKESAKKLGIRYSAANTHMNGIYKKLNVQTRGELIIRYRNVN